MTRKITKTKSPAAAKGTDGRGAPPSPPVPAKQKEVVLRARDLMERGVRTVAPDTTIKELAEIFDEEGVSGLPVVERNRLIGVVSKTDIARALAEEGVETVSRAVQPVLGVEEDDDVELEADLNGHADLSLTAQTLMTTNVISAGEDETASELASRMLEHGIHRVIITKRDQLVGVVSSFDLLRAIVDYESLLTNR